jgi:two-component system CheB/CheR fusion protein
MMHMEDEDGGPIPSDSTPGQRAARGESFSMQFTLQMGDGGRRWFEANGQPLTTPALGDGVEHWGLVVIRDITDRNLRRLREEFVASVSHELQTPLTAIRASLGMLATALTERIDVDEQELLDGARQHVERLRVQIDDLLAANQIEAGTLRLDFEPCDVRTAVSRAVSVVQPLLVQKGQSLQLDLPEPLPMLGDIRRLEQIFVNLLANAHRHTPSGTHVVVEGHATSNLVHMVVRDNGPGIPLESREDIFRRFYRANPGASGSGLGLAITQTLVELHGGRIWLERSPGHGASFHIDLPVAGREGEP